GGTRTPAGEIDARGELPPVSARRSGEGSQLLACGLPASLRREREPLEGFPPVLRSVIPEGREDRDSRCCLRVPSVSRVGEEAGAFGCQERRAIARQKPLSEFPHARQAACARTASEGVDGFTMTPLGVVLFC